MKIALVNIEPKIENTAYMQISQYYKNKGASVEWYSPLFHREYAKIYCSSLFTFTSKKLVTLDMVCGGTGFEEKVKTRLPPEIETTDLDYSLYPKCKTSYLWFSRGCIRACPFCVVPKKEGPLIPVEPKNLNPNGVYVSVMDNNPTANPHFFKVIEYLLRLDQPIDFQSGVDVRTFSDKIGEALKRLRYWNYFHTAWDNPRENLTDKFEHLMQYIPKSRIMVYVLIGYWSTPEEDLYRVTELRKRGLSPWAMPYNKKDPYQKAFERWCNRHPGCEWKDYKYRPSATSIKV